MGRRGLSQGQLYREYRKLYDQVPRVDCAGRCWDTCTRFQVPKQENRRLWRETGLQVEPPGTPPHPPCPLLVNGQCSAYAIRPLICRLWGSSAIYPCNYGCRPDAGLLSVKDTYLLMARAYELSGEQGEAEACALVASLPDAELAVMTPALQALVGGRISFREALARRDAAIARLHDIGGMTSREREVG
jgi:uncharacterized protein